MCVCRIRTVLSSLHASMYVRIEFQIHTCTLRLRRYYVARIRWQIADKEHFLEYGTMEAPCYRSLSTLRVARLRWDAAYNRCGLLRQIIREIITTIHDFVSTSASSNYSIVWSILDPPFVCILYPSESPYRITEWGPLCGQRPWLFCGSQISRNNIHFTESCPNICTFASVPADPTPHPSIVSRVSRDHTKPRKHIRFFFLYNRIQAACFPNYPICHDCEWRLWRKLSITRLGLLCTRGRTLWVGICVLHILYIPTRYAQRTFINTHIGLVSIWNGSPVWNRNLYKYLYFIFKIPKSSHFEKTFSLGL